MDWSPATPTPMTSTFAGGTVPAAVMNMGKNLPRCSAAASPARYPETVACELRASMPCARLIRGSWSKLKTVTPRAARTRRVSADCAGWKKLSSMAPGGTSVALSGVGRIDADHQGHPLVGGGCVGGDEGPGRDVGGVGERRLSAGAGLDHDLAAGGDQLLDHVGYERHAALSGSCLGGDGQFHAGCV